MSSIFKSGRAEIQANLTPLIDVTFLLIVFFVVVSQLVEIESVDMTLPAPEDPATVLPDESARVVINVIPAPKGGIAGYRVGGTDFGPMEAGVQSMTAHIAALYETNPAVQINLRADRTTKYEHVEPAMTAVSRAAALAGNAEARVNLVVTREK